MERMAAKEEFQNTQCQFSAAKMVEIIP